MNVYQKINEVKKSVKVFSKDAETSGKGAYSYVSGAQILALIKDKMEEVGLLFLPVGTEHRNYQTFDYKNSYGDTKTDFRDCLNKRKGKRKEGITNKEVVSELLWITQFFGGGGSLLEICISIETPQKCV